MIGFNLRKYANEIRRYIRNFQYERAPEGLYFPKARALMRGTYTHWVTGYESEVQHTSNIVTDEGLRHFLEVGLRGPAGVGTQITSWYLMLHSGSGTPTATITAANYNATLSEITSGTEGYSEATRVQWVGDATSGSPGDASYTELVNDTSPGTFTIVTASSLGVWGAGLTSVSTKGSTSGVLISAGKFGAQRNLSNTDEFNLKYKVDFDGV